LEDANRKQLVSSTKTVSKKINRLWWDFSETPWHALSIGNDRVKIETHTLPRPPNKTEGTKRTDGKKKITPSMKRI